MPLQAILCTGELHRRPARPPDYERENRALTTLVQALADSPRTILQTLADTILEVVNADSAGMSLLTPDEQRFYWAAIAGAWQPHLGGGTPRDFGPCGDVLDCNAPLLFRHWEQRYPYLLAATPLAEEGLLIPFYVDGRAVGTIWAIAHSDRRKFDAEDLRQLAGMGRFASAAYQTAASLDALSAGAEELRVSQAEIVQRDAELHLMEDSRRAALNLMEDAVQSRRALEELEEERNRLLGAERLARQEAEEANRLKDEFLTTVSHELRTPLNAMLGWLRLLRGGMLDEIKAARALVIVERNARAQHELVADLLDVSRIMSGKLRFEPRLTDLAAVIEAAMEAVRPAAEAKGVDMRLALDPTAGTVWGDASRLQQIVWNLLTNAIKYTPAGEHIETRLGREGTQAVITVEDTGEGITADFLPHVFARFRQADGSTTRRHGGLGLGLALVRYLAEAHGGQVHASSGGAGHGATFTITLPLISAPVTAEATGHEDAGQTVIHWRDRLRGVRVLVVDDEGDARELLSVALAHGGAAVKSVATASDALDLLLGGWQPSVLVSDIGMPERDGYELMHQVRALPAERGGRIPAVAVTGYASLEGQRRALAAGYQLFVPKPVDLDELSAAIARLVVKD